MSNFTINVFDENSRLIKAGIFADEEEKRAIRFYGFCGFFSTFLIGSSMYLVYITYAHAK